MGRTPFDQAQDRLRYGLHYAPAYSGCSVIYQLNAYRMRN
jgi:hypothetical protein